MTDRFWAAFPSSTFSSLVFFLAGPPALFSSTDFLPGGRELNLFWRSSISVWLTSCSSSTLVQNAFSVSLATGICFQFVFLIFFSTDHFLFLLMPSFVRMS